MPYSPTKGHCAIPIPLVGYWVLGQKSECSHSAVLCGVSVRPNTRLVPISAKSDPDSSGGSLEGSIPPPPPLPVNDDKPVRLQLFPMCFGTPIVVLEVVEPVRRTRLHWSPLEKLTD